MYFETPAASDSGYGEGHGLEIFSVNKKGVVRKANLPEPVSGAVPGDGVVYAAGYERGIYIIKCENVIAESKRNIDAQKIPTSESEESITREGKTLRYRPCGLPLPMGMGKLPGR